ncbi:aspartate-semialdehyde dehydrogenase domain protein [Paenibacillus sp. HGF5]|nr:aspartate-semialdehyde dehydrogenase domain protein [Paenibacillus sp. HGF5]
MTTQQRHRLLREAVKEPGVFAGRLRRDLGHERQFTIWIVSDHLLKGAAWNAVQIAEIIVNKRNGQA